MKNKDQRYSIANREALIGVVLVIIHFLIWFGFAYGLGSKPVEEYTYIFGLPAWFFYSCVFGMIFICVLVAIVVTFLFKDVSLEDEGDET